MSQSKYVLVANDGSSHDLSRRTLFNDGRFDLPELLEQGWRPVHETPMGKGPFYDSEGNPFGEYAVVLVLLVKD